MMPNFQLIHSRQEQQQQQRMENVSFNNKSSNNGTMNVSANECPICCNLFRSPKCLSCGHTICSDCCQRLSRADMVIECPVCRQMTVIPAEGLPTNYALMEMLNQAQTPKTVRSIKPYACVECTRRCSVDEAWLCRRQECVQSSRNQCDTSNLVNAILLCSHCVIAKHADHPGGKNGAGRLVESVSDALVQFENMIVDLKRDLDADRPQSEQWKDKTKKAVYEINTCANDVLEACRRLTQSALDDIEKVDQEFENARVAANALNASDQHVDVLNVIPRAVDEIKKNCKQLIDLRRNTNARMESAMESLRIGLDCILKIENGETRGGFMVEPIASSERAPPMVQIQQQQQHQQLHQQQQPIMMQQQAPPQQHHHQPPRLKSPPPPIRPMINQASSISSSKSTMNNIAPTQMFFPIVVNSDPQIGGFDSPPLAQQQQHHQQVQQQQQQQRHIRHAPPPAHAQPVAGILRNQQQQQHQQQSRSNQQQQQQQQHRSMARYQQPDTPAGPLLSSTSNSINLNQSSFSMVSSSTVPRGMSTPISSPTRFSGFGFTSASTLRRPPKCPSTASSTASAAGADFYRSMYAYRGNGYRK